MLVSEVVFERMKSLGVTNGVFLFVSNDSKQLEEQALTFATRLLGYGKDDLALNYKLFKPENGFISADQVNSFVAFEAKKAVGVPSKILIMHSIDLLKDSTSDKMLKCIEDYNNDSFIVFTTSHIENVSRTIKSRCMVFKEWSRVDDEFVTGKDQYLSFLDRMESLEKFSDAQKLTSEIENVMATDIIKALFVNSEDAQVLEIASHALDAQLTGSNDDQVKSYLISSFWCLRHGLRKWGNAETWED